MWSSDRRSLLAGAAALLSLAACGFTPAYAPGGAGDRLQGQIRADAPGDSEDYVFVARMEDRLGRSTESAPMLLRYKIDTNSDGLAITSDQETLRYHLTGEAAFSVVDRSTGAVLTSGWVESFTSYSAIGTTVATRASEKDATERLMLILADEVTTQLLATAGTWLP